MKRDCFVGPTGLLAMTVMKNKKGFTLIEIVMAITLAGILLTSIVGVCFPLKKSIKSSREKSQIQDQLSVLFNRLDKDLSYAFIPFGLEENSFQGGREKIDFHSLERVQFAGKETLPGARRTVYRFIADQGILERGERSLLSKKNRVEYLTIAKGIREIQFHFLFDKGWLSKWDDPEWPLGIKITGIIENQHGEGVSFEKTFYPIKS